MIEGFVNFDDQPGEFSPVKDEARPGSGSIYPGMVAAIQQKSLSLFD
jgi:hypothetical protein